MAKVYKKTYTRRELLKRVGNISQLAEVRPFRYDEGKPDGLKAYDIVNAGGLEFTVVGGKCLDIYNAKYKGINLNFLSKPGLVSPSIAETQGSNFLRSVSGGLIYTCGFSNVGNDCNDDGMYQCFHGRMRNLPAEKIGIISEWDKDDYILGVEGKVRDAALFHDNLSLHRTISTKLGSKCLTISDEIENEGYEEQVLMLMYHINVGFPVLDENSRILLPENQVTPMDLEAEKGLKDHEKLSGPIDHFKEQVFFHKVAAEKDGTSAAAVVNDRLGIGLYIKYNVNQFPNLIQWKSMMSGDYVVGIHPANCLCKGRLDEKERGTIKTIKPFEKQRYGVEIGILDGKREIERFERYIKLL